MDKTALKEKIKQADDTKIVKVPMPEWKTEVYVKTLGGEELVKFRKYENKQQDQDIYLLALTLCTESGELLYEPDEIEELKERAWAPLAKLIVVAQRLNAVDEKAFEGLLENLGLAQQND